MCHPPDLSNRLDTEHAANARRRPAADETSVELNQKDVTDMARLLASHEPSDHGGAKLIGLPRLESVLGSD